MELDPQNNAPQFSNFDSWKNELPTWRPFFAYAPSIEGMHKMQGEIFEQVMKQRSSWIHDRKLHWLMMDKGESLKEGIPIKVVTELPYVRHVPVYDNPNTQDRIMLSDGTGELEVRLIKDVEARARRMGGMTIPNRRVLRENSWESVAWVATDLRYYESPRLVFVEEPPEEMESVGEMKANTPLHVPRLENWGIYS